MPNNTQNILVLDGSAEDIEKFRNLVLKTDESGELNFDFNAIVPMHEDLNIVSGSTGDEAYTCLHGTDEDVQCYLNMTWVKEAGITTREELTTFLEKRAGRNIADELSWREMGDRYASNLEKYGHKTWYNWCCENWGTKWGAYKTKIEDDCDVERLVIQFQTAWSPPIPIYRKISELFPELDIEAYWSDEGSYEREKVFDSSF